MKNNTQSFTLIELLVVIALLGTFAVLLFPSYLSTFSKSRDAKRKSDIKALQNALEQYYSSCSYVYPSANPIAGLLTAVQCGTTPAIISSIPVDPKSGGNYIYTPTGTSGFGLCANEMESESPTGFCVYNQQ